MFNIFKSCWNFIIKFITLVYKYYSEYSQPTAKINIKIPNSLNSQNSEKFKHVVINKKIMFGAGYCESCNCNECKKLDIQYGIKLKFNSRIKRFFRNKKYMKYIKDD